MNPMGTAYSHLVGTFWPFCVRWSVELVKEIQDRLALYAVGQPFRRHKAA